MYSLCIGHGFRRLNIFMRINRDGYVGGAVKRRKGEWVLGPRSRPRHPRRHPRDSLGESAAWLVVLQPAPLRRPSQTAPGPEPLLLSLAHSGKDFLICDNSVNVSLSIIFPLYAGPASHFFTFWQLSFTIPQLKMVLRHGDWMEGMDTPDDGLCPHLRIEWLVFFYFPILYSVIPDYNQCCYAHFRGYNKAFRIYKLRPDERPEGRCSRKEPPNGKCEHGPTKDSSDVWLKRSATCELFLKKVPYSPFRYCKFVTATFNLALKANNFFCANTPLCFG